MQDLGNIFGKHGVELKEFEEFSDDSPSVEVYWVANELAVQVVVDEQFFKLSEERGLVGFSRLSHWELVEVDLFEVHQTHAGCFAHRKYVVGYEYVVDALPYVLLDPLVVAAQHREHKLEGDKLPEKSS